MRFLMFVAEDPDAEPYIAAEDNIGDWVDEMLARGVEIRGDRLRPPAEAKTVKVRDGQTLVTDGPFAETRELIAGYDILECADLDEAIEVAGKHPMARFGRLELRPLWPLDFGL